MDRARWIVVFAYAVALVVALIVGHRVTFEHPIAVALAADVAATVVIFLFSVAFRNSSFYDAYWSVVPPVIALYWAQRPEAVGVNPFRLAIVTALIWLWGARLTWNWNRGWTGLDHEDWRYVDLKEKTGVFYWLVSLLGIHMMPTLWVFGGMLPVYAVMAAGTVPFGPLDGLAFAVTLGRLQRVLYFNIHLFDHSIHPVGPIESDDADIVLLPKFNRCIIHLKPPQFRRLASPYRQFVVDDDTLLYFLSQMN